MSAGTSNSDNIVARNKKIHVGDRGTIKEWLTYTRNSTLKSVFYGSLPGALSYIFTSKINLSKGIFAGVTSITLVGYSWQYVNNELITGFSIKDYLTMKDDED